MKEFKQDCVLIRDVEYSVHNSRNDNLCNSDTQVDIYLKLLINTNPVVFYSLQKVS